MHDEAKTIGVRAAVSALEVGGDVVAAVTAAAEALAGDPWAVVEGAGPLARARWSTRDVDVALDADLVERAAGDRRVVAIVPAGAPCPCNDLAGRRARGAFDTPRALARATVAAALDATTGPVRVALDPCCGTGALLVALAEAGIARIVGGDLDPLAVAVARVAAPRAEIDVADALDGGVDVDLVVGNPPFVSAERQDRATRDRLEARFPWLVGRYDLAVPLAAASAARARSGGGVALILPAPVLVERYGEPLRRAWLARDAVREVRAAGRFPGVAVEVAIVALTIGAGPARVADGPLAADVLSLPTAPLDPWIRADDVALVAAIRARSVPVGSLALVDTGAVLHGGGRTKASRLHDVPGPGRVPFADARDLTSGRRRWLLPDPAMHRAKSDAHFRPPKLVVQRLSGGRPLRVHVDRDGVVVGHTCLVVVPHTAAIALERLRELLTDPVIVALLRIERGPRLDVYPHDVAAIPVPRAWLHDATTPLAAAWGTTDVVLDDLRRRVARVRAGACDAG